MNEQTLSEIRRKLDDYSMPAPEVPWDALEQALAANSRRRRIATWLKAGAAAAVAMLLAGGAWWMLSEENKKGGGPATAIVPTHPADHTHTDKDSVGAAAVSEPLSDNFSVSTTAESGKTEQLLHTQTTDRKTADAYRIRDNKVFSHHPHQPALADNVSAEPLKESAPSLLPVKEPADNKPDGILKQPILAEMLNSDAGTVFKPEKQQANGETANVKSETATLGISSPPTLYEVPEQQERSRQKPVQRLPFGAVGTDELPKSPAPIPHFTAKAFFSNNGIGGIASSLGRVAEDTYYSSPGDGAVASPNDPCKDDDSSDENKNANKTSPKKMKTKETEYGSVRHHQPIRFGVSLSWQLNNRWSIDGGITYSRLNTDITGGKGKDVYSLTDQQLYYIGIPINVNYSIWHNRHFNVYVSAGGMVEKMVKGEQTTRKATVHGGKMDSVTSQDIHIHPLQLSVNAAAGAEFKFNRLLSIYTEPGISYHFDNSSSLSSFYTDYPLGFNLTFGLRFNIK